MAEFCYECYKKILKGKKEKYELIISMCLDFCEGCGEFKPVVVREKRYLELLSNKLFRR